MKKILFLTWIIPLTLSGQRYISGRITDAKDGNPIPAVTVFFTNTTVGTTTDTEGNYRLEIPGEGSYSLTVSHVGYQSVIKDIEPGIASIVFNVAMYIKELDEVEIVTQVRFRQRDINLFWRTLLGKNPSRRTIQATNPETVYYYYNPETRILKVTCREPIQIINYETGYHIQCVLDNFTHDYNTAHSEWSHQCVFTELEPANLRQKNNWEAKREEIYKVSLTKFIKSLYNNTLHNDGYVLANFLPTSDPSNPFSLSILSQDSILSTISDDNSKTLDLSNHQILLLCYGRSITDYDLERLEQLQYANRNYGGLFSIGRSALGISEGQPIEQLDDHGLFRNLLQGKFIRIFPDGSYANKLWMNPVNASETLLGLSMRLPLEYLPEGHMPSGTIEDFSFDNNQYWYANISADIDQRFNEQLRIFPQEKLHLHTDRDYYVPGEKIWFKAYVTDAASHQYPTDSRYVYVELISSVDTLINRVMVRPEEGMFHGYLPINEIIPEGDYTLRAYTRYMENLGDDYFFKKNIQIGALSSANSQVSPTSQSSQRAENEGNSENGESLGNRGGIQDDFDVTFFPEGGNLPEGVLSKVGFKALNINGYPEKITGALIDENGVEIVSVETFYAGMGAFDYKAEKGKKIFLKCKNINGLERQFELPQPLPQAYSLAAYQQSDSLLIKVNKAIHTPDIPCYLLAHCRGEVLYFAEWDKVKESILFEERQFPAGIIQFVLFDEQMNPLSERLVFNKNYDRAKVEFQTDKASYKSRDHVVSTLSISDAAGNLLKGHLSVAITDDKDITVDSSTTILSTLLLSSELRGYIEDPAWYLQDNTASVIALDYLMLTHGWRRYAIPELIQGNPKHPQILFQTSQQISGKVQTLTRPRPVTDSEISILTNDGDFGLTSTDEQGEFIFQDFEYPDNTPFYIQALSTRGNSQVELVVDEESFPKLIHAVQSPFEEIPAIRNETIIDLKPDAFITKAEQRSMYDDDMRMIYLDEVVVTALRIERKNETRLQYWANSSADVTIRREEIERNNPLTVTELLSSIPSIRVLNDGGIIIREAGNLFNAYQPLVLIDGISVLSVESVSVSEVESIDVFTGGRAAVFGTRGAGGAISITTKQGITGSNREEETTNYIVYTPLGYQNPVEFYSPVYETLESKHLTIPDFRTTIFWKPDIVISNEEEGTTFDFYTSDFQTTYSVVIEGLTTDGRIIRQVEKIQVE